MIIKVRDAKEGWWLFESDTRIHYSNRIWKSKEEYESYPPCRWMIWENTFPGDWDYGKSPFEFGLITFRSSDDREEYCILFNTVAYICNHAGQTLEVVSING